MRTINFKRVVLVLLCSLFFVRFGIAKEATQGVSISSVQSSVGLGSMQGLEVREGHVFLYGDAETGIIQEYVLKNEKLTAVGKPILLTSQGKDMLPHPTGLTFHKTHGTFMGSTVLGVGKIYQLDWKKILANRTVEGAILHVIQDDAAVNGTRPEFVRVGRRWYLATSDYGPKGNEVRLYDPERLKKATKTTEAGVLFVRFPVTPWVQNLHWIDAKGELVLVQNQIAGLGWRLTFIDLESSIKNGKAEIVRVVDLGPKDELEGFHMLDQKRAIGVSSSAKENMVFLKVR